jgi:hypothetical protein
VTLQDAGDPLFTSAVHALPSLQLAGQLPSHVSPCSTIPLPHVEEQSESLLAVQPGPQHPSPETQIAIGLWAQTTSHVATLPVMTSVVQATPSSQDRGQLPSHVSPGSVTPLPHFEGQLTSFRHGDHTLHVPLSHVRVCVPQPPHFWDDGPEQFAPPQIGVPPAAEQASPFWQRSASQHGWASCPHAGSPSASWQCPIHDSRSPLAPISSAYFPQPTSHTASHAGSAWQIWSIAPFTPATVAAPNFAA